MAKGFEDDQNINPDSVDDIQKEIDSVSNKNDEIAYKVMSTDITKGINKHDIDKVHLEDTDDYNENALIIDISEKTTITESLLLAIKDILNYMQKYTETVEGVTTEEDEETMSVYVKTLTGVRKIGDCKKFNMQQYGISALKKLLGENVNLYTHYKGDKKFRKHRNNISEIKLRIR